MPETSMHTDRRSAQSDWPLHGWLGIILVTLFWGINWLAPGLRTHWAFFPMWLGYILTTDALAVWRGRSSLIRGRMGQFLMLFAFSAVIWWIFEAVNARAQYWQYTAMGVFSDLEYAWWSTLSFSTVVPAIFSTANVLLSFSWFQHHHIRWHTAVSIRGRWIYLCVGVLMFAAVMIWPEYGMAFLWISLFFILDPVNARLGFPSLMRQTADGDWRLVIVFCAAALVCGFFWEMWNSYSWPKWIYTFDYLRWFPVFEMPLAGYLGYLPFGLEIYAVVGLCASLLGLRYNVQTEDMRHDIL